jgi:hypothetical protein
MTSSMRMGCFRDGIPATDEPAKAPVLEVRGRDVRHSSEYLLPSEHWPDVLAVRAAK